MEFYVQYRKQNEKVADETLSFFLGRCRPVTHFQNRDSFIVSELNVFDTMPKRIRSKSAHKSKRARESVELPSHRRISIPRHCKSSLPITNNIVSFYSTPSSKSVMGAIQVKANDKEKETKKEKVEEASGGWSSDELDIVFDVQEEKKNKIYEVITVMSDDETPNKITYERLYADDGENKVVETPKDLDNSIKSDVPIVSSVPQETSSLLDDILTAGKVSTAENSASTIKNSKDDSDNDVICVAVIDAKTKEEQRRAKIEEICLSSDSEPENSPTVPPLRIKLSNYPYLSGLLPNNSSEHSFGSHNSNNSLEFRNSLPLFPLSKRNFLYNNVYSDTDSDSDSYPSSPKIISSDGFSPTRSETPKILSGDECSSSGLSEPQGNFSSSSDNLNSPSPSPVSSSDGEKDIYWKASREFRRKRELRYEEFTELGKRVHEGKTEVNADASLTFKVMSYNVLAQNLLEQHRYLYQHHDRRALVWARRWELLYNEIKDENPEILCLQEVEHAHLISHYAKLLDLGYRWIYKKRTGEYRDGVAVFYKTVMFEEETHSAVEFYQPGVSVLDRDNVGLVVRLRLKSHPNHAVVVATTHLLYNPRRSDVKLAQTQVLLAEIDRLSFDKNASAYYPVILSGDFNLRPSNGVYQLVTEGQLMYEGMSRHTLRKAEDSNVLPRTLLPIRLGITDRCQHVDVIEARARGEEAAQTRLYHSENNKDPQQDNSEDDRFASGTLYHNLHLKSAYPPNGKKEATTHQDNWITVDYLFYSSPKSSGGQKEDGSLQLLSRLRLPTQDECERFLRRLPNFAFGSDHLPLVGKFLLRLHCELV